MKYLLFLAETQDGHMLEHCRDHNSYPRLQWLNLKKPHTLKIINDKTKQIYKDLEDTSKLCRWTDRQRDRRRSMWIDVERTGTSVQAIESKNKIRIIN